MGWRGGRSGHPGKVLLCCGNVDGVEHVDDSLTVTNPEPPARFHTVVRRHLSAIAKTYYGNANAYMKIFEANKPMLATRTRSISGPETAHSRLICRRFPMIGGSCRL